MNKENVIDKTFSYLKDKMDGSEFDKMYKFSNYSDPLIMLNELKSNNMISSSLYAIVEKDLNLFQATDSYKDVEVIVNQRLKERRELSKDDEKIYLSLLSVAKHSAYFWDVYGENGIKYLPYSETVVMKSNGPDDNITFEYE